MGKFNIGDKVWFPFSNGTKEQAGVIQNVIHYASFDDDYVILGNVDGKLYTKRENELYTIAPHKRWLDPTEYTPDWESQTKAIKKLEKELEEEAKKDFKVGDEVLYYEGTHCNKNIRTGVITRVDYNPLYCYYEYRVRKLFTTILKIYTERDIICRTMDAEEYSKTLGINLGYFAKATNDYERKFAEIKDAMETWKPTISNIDYSSMYPGIPVDCKTNIPLDPSGTYGYLSDYFNNSYSWQIAHPITFSNMPDNNSVIKLDFNVDILKEDNNMKKKQQNQRRRNRNVIKNNGTYSRDINEIIFNGPATIIKWSPSMDQFAYNKKGDKTVAVCGKDDEFDKTTGFLLAIIKEFFDNQSYDNILRKIDSFKEEKEKDIPNVSDVWDSLPEKEKDIITDDISKAIREKLRDEYVPEQKFYMSDTVTFKSKGSHHYTVDNYRWNAEHKCWEYRIYNHVSHRWYEESRLVLVQRAININDIVRIGGSLLMHRVVDKNWNSVKGQHEYTLVQVGDPIETKITRLYSDLRKLYDSSSDIAKHFRTLA